MLYDHWYNRKPAIELRRRVRLVRSSSAESEEKLGCCMTIGKGDVTLSETYSMILLKMVGDCFNGCYKCI